MPTEEDATNQDANQQQVSVTAESHPMNVELHSRTKPHSNVKLQNEIGEHSNSKVGVHERDSEIPDKEIHSD